VVNAKGIKSVVFDGFETVSNDYCHTFLSVAIYYRMDTGTRSYHRNVTIKEEKTQYS